VHSTTLMAGYHGQKESDSSTHWRDEHGRRFVRTGDVGRLDDEGFLWLCDRKKDMIISGGYNVFPADIEKVLSDHPAVFEVAVIGFPSHKWGETPVAIVTLQREATANAEELRDWANARLGAIQRLAAVRVVPELPSGGMGKILKATVACRVRRRDRDAPVTYEESIAHPLPIGGGTRVAVDGLLQAAPAPR